jgi:tetratricopeptide (TPR) repeat protein
LVINGYSRRHRLKFKPIYLYTGILIIIAIFLIIVTQSQPTNKNTKVDITSKQMPKDNLHKNLGMQEQSPSSSNVNDEVFKKLQILKERADSKPTDTLKIREYADFLSAAHKPEEAIIYYEKILGIDKKRKDIYLSITFDYYNQGKLEKAEEITGQMLKIFPNDPMATYNLGAIEAAKGNKNKAREIWTKLISTNPNDKTAILAKNSINKL